VVVNRMFFESRGTGNGIIHSTVYYYSIVLDIIYL
jgi:hypothetical protein